MNYSAHWVFRDVWCTGAVGCSCWAIEMSLGCVQKLSNFFKGSNYEHKEVERSTPLRVDFNVWDLGSQRYSSYWVPLEEEVSHGAALVPQQLGQLARLVWKTVCSEFLHPGAWAVICFISIQPGALKKPAAICNCSL